MISNRNHYWNMSGTFLIKQYQDIRSSWLACAVGAGPRHTGKVHPPRAGLVKELQRVLNDTSPGG